MEDYQKTLWWNFQIIFHIQRMEHLALIVSRLSLTSHTGTHLDAPAHLFERGLSMEFFPLELMKGKALVEALNNNLDQTIRLLAQHPVQLLILRTNETHLSPPKISANQINAIKSSGFEIIGTNRLSLDGLDREELPDHQTCSFSLAGPQAG